MSKENDTKNKYKDIIDMPHHVSTKRRQMPIKDRAAQFASFAALTGYKEVIDDASDKAMKDNDK